MKALRIAGLTLVVLALLAGFGAMAAAADGPVANAAPINAPYIDNQVHTLQPNGSMLFRFDYNISDPSSRPVSTVTLIDGNASGVTFDVWTPDMVTDMADNSPIGKASSFNVPCDGGGTCTSADLLWSGAFGASGPYYVRVINTNSTTATAKLLISGDGVMLAPAAPIAVTGPSANAQTVANMDDPARAVVIDGSSKSIPANSVQWYSFNYGFNDDGSRPTRLITLANGNQTGVSFQVYAPEVLSNWWQNMPTGTGTPGMTACDTGMCTSNDLTWLGAFGATGTYYVRVINNTSNALNAMLTIQ